MHDSAHAARLDGSSSSHPQAPWWEVSLCVPRAVADDAGALLVDAGAMGVETCTPTAFARRAWQQHASMGPRRGDPASDAVEGGDGQSVYLVISFAGDRPRHEVVDLLADTLDGFGPAARLQAAVIVCRHDTAWAHAWREHFKPLKIGRSIWVVPRWEVAFAPPLGSTVLRIDPGMAFGTGQHATTSLCLKAIERRMACAKRLATPVRVLDVGAGSGILAMAALLLGAQDAVLVDIDPLALDACRDNVASAGLERRAVVQQQLPPAQPAFALVVANILAGTLIDMMPSLLERLAPGGTLLLSGILLEQADAVSAAVLRQANASGRALPPVARLQHDKWVALAFGGPLDAPPTAH